MKTEKKNKYRRVPARIVIAHFNDKLAACVNTGIASCFGSNFENQLAGSSSRLAMLESGVHHQNARGPHAPYQRQAASGCICAAMYWSCAICCWIANC